MTDDEEYDNIWIIMDRVITIPNDKQLDSMPKVLLTPWQIIIFRINQHVLTASQSCSFDYILFVLLF